MTAPADPGAGAGAGRERGGGAESDGGGRGRRPTAHEVVDLLGEYDRMLADAGGWATRIPADRVARWERDKRDLLARIEAHTPGLRVDEGREVEGPGL